LGAWLLALLVVTAEPVRSFDGLVLPYREVTIASPVEARIEALNVREGDRVEAGAVLVDLYAGMEKLEAKRAAAAVEKREFEFKSSKNLFDENVISEDEALQSRIELDLAKLTFEMAQERVALRRLEAPMSGVVVERLRETGEMVRPSEPILELIDLSQVIAQFYVRSEDLAEVRVGRSVSIRFPSLGADIVRNGRIEFIDPRVDAASGLLRVRVRLPNADGVIKVGVRAAVTLGNTEGS
jgi:RND family efflux transporter MFP subunit